MKIPVFCAGALEVRWSYFIAIVLLSRTIRYIALASLGAHFGTETFAYLKHHALFVIIVITGLAVLSVVLLRILDSTKRDSSGEAKAGL